MEVYQSMGYFFFVGQTLPTCSEVTFEMLNSARVRVEIDKNWQEYKLEGKLDWPGKTVIDEVGRFKVKLTKRRPKQWSEAGKIADDIPQDNYNFKPMERHYHPVVIENKRMFGNDDACELTFRHTDHIYHYIYPGKHICIYLRMDGKRSRYPFYPTIEFPYYNITHPNRHIRDFEWTNRPMRVLISDYGRKDSFHYRLCHQYKPNDVLYISIPKGGFCPTFINGYDKVNVFVETIGIGAALPVILYLLQMNPIVKISVFYFYHEESEFIYKEEVEDMVKLEPRLSLQYIQRQFTFGEVGWKNAIPNTFLEHFIGKWTNAYREFGIVAGHRQFIFPVGQWLLTHFQYPNGTVFRFLTT